MTKIYKKRHLSTRNFKDPKYIFWRKCIYQRDGYKCAWPGCTCKSRLNAHHIRRWANYPTLRFDINNGITLCYRHHSLIKNNEDNYVLFFIDILRRKIK